MSHSRLLFMRWCVVLLALLMVFAPDVDAQDSTEEAVNVFKQVSPSVVELSSLTVHGTGILLNADGLVLTNAHVVVSPVPFRAKLEVSRDGKSETAEFKDVEVVAMHPKLDLALVRLNLKQQPGIQVTPARLTRAKVSPGQRVYAIGNPSTQGVTLTRTITTGLLSGVDRRIDGVNYYQISAPVNPGNSGGPLTDREGAVLGIVTLKSEGVENVGFAIPLANLDLSEFGPPRRQSADKPNSERMQKLASELLKQYEPYEKRKQTELPEAKLLQFLTVQAYLEALMYDPADPKTSYMLGVMLTSYQEYDAAVGFLLESLELDPWGGGGAVYRWIGLSLARHTQLDDAAVVWHEGVAKHPFLASQVWEDLAIMHRDRGEWEESGRCAGMALYLHHLKRPNVRPDLAKAIIALCRTKIPPAKLEAFEAMIKAVPETMKQSEAQAQELKKAGRVTVTPEFEKWLETKNRSLGRDRRQQAKPFVKLTNAELPPFDRAGNSVALNANPSSSSPASGPDKASAPLSNLLERIDLNQNTVRGNWTLQADKLLSPRTTKARIELPIDVPREYDLEFTAMRVAGTGELVVGFVRDGIQSALFLDRLGRESGLAGLGSALYKKPILPLNRAVPLTLRIRRDGFTLLTEGRELFSKSAPGDFPRTPADWLVRNKLSLFLGSESSTFEIQKVTVKAANEKK